MSHPLKMDAWTYSWQILKGFQENLRSCVHLVRSTTGQKKETPQGQMFEFFPEFTGFSPVIVFRQLLMNVFQSIMLKIIWT